VKIVGTHVSKKAYNKSETRAFGILKNQIADIFQDDEDDIQFKTDKKAKRKLYPI